MKRDKIIFWATTAVISLMMLFSAYSYFAIDDVKAAFVHLGYPGYFRVELALAKIAGALVLILPMVSPRLKEFAYFGFTIVFISAFIAHSVNGDPMSVAIMPLIFLGILAVSYIYFNKSKSLSTH